MRIELEYAEQISLAAQQNAIPVIHRLTLYNESSQALEAVEVVLTIDDLATPWKQTLERLEAGASHEWNAVDLRLAPERLVTVSEAIATHLRARAVSGENQHERLFPLEVLAYNQWIGVRGLPELLAAFVLPNHPEVATLLREASAILKLEDGAGCLDGYQSCRAEQVRRQLSALYSAIAARSWSYVGVPASFEVGGQKIRTPDQIADQRLANCLDLSCLMAACLEQAGLHPLIILLEGHAFVGVWLDRESTAGGVSFDVATLRKSYELGGLAVVETTAALSAISFQDAEQKAYAALNDRFHYALDIHLIRAMRIRPLPLRLSSQGVVTLVEEIKIESPPEASRAETSGAGLRRAAQRSQWQLRFEPWRNRLLDLTMRNRLLNFRAGSRSTLALLVPEPERFEDELSKGRVFTLLSQPRSLESAGVRKPELAEKLSGGDPIREEVLASLSRRVLHSELSAQEHQERLLEIFRATRTSWEETGARILYLALGFLKWYETPQADKSRLAPLILIPVDLERGNVREAFKLRRSDEEIRPNFTLLQKLSQEFKLNVDELSEIPEDEQGCDVTAYLNRVRAAILNVPRWEVDSNRVELGLFSFSKLLMWLDLDNYAEDDLLRELLEGRLRERQSQPPDASTLDDPGQLHDCLCVVDSDSSQLRAVRASLEGHSFVLQGPPGTGKSQTITNMIARNLAEGRSVLFVAEKLAALQVVSKRLQQVGLAPFCLELHSNKAQKSDIIRQLREAHEASQSAPPGGWERHIEEVERLRCELNDYVRALHDPRPLGCTVFSAHARCIQLEALPDLEFPDASPASTIAQWEARFRAIEALEVSCGSLGIPSHHPWSASHLRQWDRLRRSSDENALRACREAAQGVTLDPRLGEEEDWEQLSWTGAMVQLVLSSPWPQQALLTANGWRPLSEKLKLWIEEGKQRQQLWSQLDKDFTPALLQMDLEEQRTAFQKWSSVKLVGWLALWARRRRLRKTARQGASPSLAQLEVAIQVQKLDATFQQREPQLRELFGSLWEGPANTDWQLLSEQVAFTERWRELAAQRSQSERWLSWVSQESSQPRPLLEAFQAGWERLSEAVAVVEQRFQLEIRWSSRNQLMQWCRERLDLLDRLADWTRFRELEGQARELGLAPLLEAYWQGEVPVTHLKNTFEKGFLQSWLVALAAHEEPLRSFHEDQQRHRIQRFQELDQLSQQLARRKIVSQLAARIPSPQGTAAASSETGILLRELKKQRAHKAPRKLFQEIRNLLPRLKPCILMSPLSVAQYLDPSLPPFDLVIFDEASQIAPWDAAGVLRRARQCIVVGDSKQLPPTSFFEKSENEENQPDDDVLLESILDECSGGGLPQLSLLWHYRSKDERLITFSNRNYYEGKLLTFPNSSTRSQAVQFRFCPEGRFERGHSRTNPVEARILVDELVERLRRSSWESASYGVVTFNSPQQLLIERLLDQARERYPEIEPHFTQASEPVFVKNLENVQGDERDVILFSIAYGRDPQERLYMNFGPLNLQGGQRRLNVAVSRARTQMVVFSSLRASDIDPRRTRHQGALDFRAFLDFAERGVEALERERNADAAAHPGFAQEVARRLGERGWEVRRNVGCSGYRLDLAVVDPRDPERFLGGIECDGPNYASGATARDRERLRHLVLSRLGWRLERAWSQEWWKDSARELQRLEARLNAWLQEEFEASAPPAEEVLLEEEPATAPPASNSVLTPYLRAELPSMSGELLRQRPELRRQLKLLLEREAPITCERAMRRLAESWGVRRVGTRIRELMMEVFTSEPGLIVHQETLWLCPPESYREVRQDDPLELPLAEVANGVERVLSDCVALAEVDLLRESARLFSTRLGRQVEARLQQAVKLLVDEGRAREEGGRIRLP